VRRRVAFPIFEFVILIDIDADAVRFAALDAVISHYLLPGRIWMFSAASRSRAKICPFPESYPPFFEIVSCRGELLREDKTGGAVPSASNYDTTDETGMNALSRHGNVV
jgi:hypothetical protein